jgi:hypothetical protein
MDVTKSALPSPVPAAYTNTPGQTTESSSHISHASTHGSEIAKGRQDTGIESVTKSLSAMDISKGASASGSSHPVATADSWKDKPLFPGFIYRFRDEEGKKINVLSKITSQTESIYSRFGLHQQYSANGQEVHPKRNETMLMEFFTLWGQKYQNHSDYPFTGQGFYELLEDIERTTVANEIHAILPNIECDSASLESTDSLQALDTQNPSTTPLATNKYPETSGFLSNYQFVETSRSSSRSIEALAFRKDTGELEKGFTSNLRHLANKLSEDDIQVITSSERDEILNTKTVLSRIDHAGTIERRVRTRIELDPSFFKDFVQILADSETLKPVAEKLARQYKTEKAKYEQEQQTQSARLTIPSVPQPYHPAPPASHQPEQQFTGTMGPHMQTTPSWQMQPQPPLLQPSGYGYNQAQFQAQGFTHQTSLPYPSQSADEYRCSQSWSSGVVQPQGGPSHLLQPGQGFNPQHPEQGGYSYPQPGYGYNPQSQVGPGFQPRNPAPYDSRLQPGSGYNPQPQAASEFQPRYPTPYNSQSQGQPPQQWPGYGYRQQ